MGISTERRQAKDGEYHIAFYNVEAQRFIIDNLQAIAKIV